MNVTHHAPVSPVGDEDSAKRRQILAGASAVFMDLGFDGASMGEIARAAGVSKGTLYVYFADKSRLFEAIVQHEVCEQGKIAFNFDFSRDAESMLTDFGIAYIKLLCRPGGGSSTRTVMAIAERMPEVGQRFYNNVIALTIDRLAKYLEARVAVGELVIDDLDLAASQFLKCCQATLFMPFLFHAKPAPTLDQIRIVVDSATRMFLAAYRAKAI